MKKLLIGMLFSSLLFALGQNPASVTISYTAVQITSTQEAWLGLQLFTEGNTSALTIELSISAASRSVYRGILAGLNPDAGAVLPGLFVAQVVEKYRDMSFWGTTRKQNGQFLSVRIRVFANEYTLMADQTFAAQIPDYRLYLITPADRSTLDNPLPLLLWSTISRPGDLVSYKLELRELMADQTPLAAMRSNPLLFSTELPMNMQLYPASAVPLVKNKTYVWGVEAYGSSGMLAKSEIWTFDLGTPQTESEPVLTYVEVANPRGSGYYLAFGKLNIRYQQALICDFSLKIRRTDGSETPVPANYVFKMDKHMYSIALPSSLGLSVGKYYQLVLTNCIGRRHNIRFLYQ